MNVFADLLTFLGQERFEQFLEQTLFGLFYDIHHIKIQCQLLRHLMIREKENVRDDMFVIKINGTELRFGIKEFSAVTGLKCGLHSTFISNPSIPNRLILEYFGEMNKVPKSDFFNKFKQPDFFENEDILKIGILYFISSFLTACSQRLENNPSSFKFSQFHIALQVWFYECCHPFDNTVAIRVSNRTPQYYFQNKWLPSHILHDFKNMVLTDEEINVMDQLNLHQSPSHHEAKIKPPQKGMMLAQMKTTNMVLTDEEINAMDQLNLHQSPSHHEAKDQATSKRHDVGSDEKYVELKKEIAEVCMYVIATPCTFNMSSAMSFGV
ncbi:hypothetical protein H5410_001727 [Solanum commersonii]|uniref:DUF1985 domain-containing protein n=1 Tax=Solanum commersonii TaxID=4109 RepID=A0A9J6B0D9_SOLCO|nr:hypothetical protein H5410_001727 [Solanum commersonii]